MTMMKPSRESKTAKRIWNRAERRSVMASTADIQVRASRGKTTHELHSDALQDTKGKAALSIFSFVGLIKNRKKARKKVKKASPKAYPARSFSFTSVMPSLDTSLLKTRIPMIMFTCGRQRNIHILELFFHIASITV